MKKKVKVTTSDVILFKLDDSKKIELLCKFKIIK